LTALDIEAGSLVQIDADARAGGGSTADALRYEEDTGVTLSSSGHRTKARESVRGIKKWLKRNPHAPASDRAAAQAVIDDLENALNGS